MTMPSERMRSVLQAREFLRELSESEGTPGVSKEIRDEAKRLLRHFPGAVDLARVAEACPDIFEPPSL